ncbi:MAG: Peptide chain release factor N(5)-glutamine methyltransferase, partial [uncultured Nocardioidaceae bacterium]
ATSRAPASTSARATRRTRSPTSTAASTSCWPTRPTSRWGSTSRWPGRCASTTPRSRCGPARTVWTRSGSWNRRPPGCCAPAARWAASTPTHRASGCRPSSSAPEAGATCATTPTSPGERASPPPGAS